MAESTHTVIVSVHDGTIEPDDAMRILLTQYFMEDSETFTVDEVENYMRSSKAEIGKYPEELVDFHLCPDCGKLTVWDDVTEDLVHLVPNPSCFLNKGERVSA